MLIDSHAHLNSDRFDRDRERIIKSLRKNDVDIVILPGTSVLTSAKVVSLAEQYHNLYATVGIHPNNTDQMDYDTISVLKALGQKKKVVAIGEIGLDYHYDYVPKEVQKKWFIEQIRLAKELKLPIAIHDREANYDTFEIVKKEHGGNLTGELHCYSGDLELAKEYVKLGFYISIAGPVTYRSAHKLKEVAQKLPLEYLLIETDAPSLTPGPLGKRRNEPAYVKYVASTIAELRGIPLETVARKTAENAKRLFNIK